MNEIYFKDLFLFYLTFNNNYDKNIIIIMSLKSFRLIAIGVFVEKHCKYFLQLCTVPY